jgi:hypothetical protein
MAAEEVSGDRHPLLTEAETETTQGETREDIRTREALVTTTRERGPTAAEAETTLPTQRDDGRLSDDAWVTQPMHKLKGN